MELCRNLVRSILDAKGQSRSTFEKPPMWLIQNAVFFYGKPLLPYVIANHNVLKFCRYLL